MRHRSSPTRGGERGFVLAIVIVFLVVLSLTASLVAGMTRTNVQVVNNIQNEKEAFYFAEAGITEAMLRLEMSPGTIVRGFDAAIVPDPGDSGWEARILEGSFAPSRTGSTFTTPTIQDPAARFPYTTGTAGAEALTIRWVPDPAGGILEVDGGATLEIVATGRSGAARRTVTVWATRDDPGPSVLTFSNACNEGLKLNGTTRLDVAGGIHVNGTCNQAVRGVGSASIRAGGPIDVVGGVSMHEPPTPTPRTGVAPVTDPLAGLLPPCFGLHVPPGCQILPAVPVPRGAPGPTNPETQQVSGGTLEPGIYYGGLDVSGNVTLNPGVYIMAGGGFRTSKNGTMLLGDGVVIYNTANDNPLFRSGDGAFGSFELGQNAGIDLTAPSNGAFEGIALFQDRSSSSPVRFQGGAQAAGSIDGVIYAWAAPMELQGGYDLATTFLVHSLEVNGNTSVTPPRDSPLGGDPALTRVAWKDF